MRCEKAHLGRLGCIPLHVLIAVSLYETGRIIALSPTIIPSKIKDTVQRFGVLLEAPLGLRFAESNPIRQSLVSYLAFAGADGGYGYFAPGIPDTYELTFELYYPDGRTEMQVARLSNSALGLRVASLLEQIGGGPSPKLREHMLKKFARVVWRQHRQVKKMRVSIWQVTLPTIEEYVGGERQKPALLCAYDFSLSAKPPPTQQ